MKYILQPLLLFIIFFSNSYSIFSQSPTIKLDNIQVNNQEAQIDKENKIYVKDGDSIRIAGLLLSGDTVLITVGENEYVSTPDEIGNWIVLFSITNISKGGYPVEAQVIADGKKGEEILLSTLVVDSELIPDQDIDNIKTDVSNFGFKDILIIILSFSLAYTLLNYFILKAKVEKLMKK